ncbi:M6 family metalloprotease domain-containing protein [Salsipaludibacter albus]|uniref:M6 family metalloprotease domain-containing protein n=1 Tax=Salsipaludibacter albus TaxID=2849650 RepID=UPI001EE4C248|nr:M6 family metalloprotease domain-containing protein [Salsipaludibacter albus]MBY5164245.1 M6 family metalloprotease domain-containing protein [Salsipaludibacter albus]
MHDPDLDIPSLARIHRLASERVAQRCAVAPSPALADRIKDVVARLDQLDEVRSVGAGAAIVQPRHPGFNDGLIIPGSRFPLGTSIEAVRSAASQRAPLHGTLRVAVVLVDFDDRPMTADADHFDDLFFSEGVLPDGSVREYFTEVTNGLVELTGEVIGPLRLPRDLATYANGRSGIGTSLPNARTMALDAAVSADPGIDFAPYDNDDDGFVDAYVVVHAGSGAEVTGSVDDIWSHKWVLPAEYRTDTTSIFAYLTVPEDARIGVCAHELGHLLFGFPDLYDTDNTSEGIGAWCLMAGGSWGGGGDRPTHPSAWCKVQQGWVMVDNVTTDGPLTIADVKDSHTVHRLWRDGEVGKEYFLVENRQADRRDASLPGGGLLIWHVDDAVPDNTNETHYRVGLEQADGAMDLERNANRGDDGDCWPGTAVRRSFTADSTPGSRSHGGIDTGVRVTAISDPGPVMTADVQVHGDQVQPDDPDGLPTTG